MSYQLVDDPLTIPPRPTDANKGTFGRVLVIAGSTGMSGAAALSGLGALRGGAGLVTVAVPTAIQPVVASIEASYMAVGLPCTAEGHFSRESLNVLLSMIQLVDVVACGPGWGQTYELQEVLSWLNGHVTRPLVIDADGLNLLAKLPNSLEQAAGPRILTPHPGEFARLTGRDIADIEANRVGLAVEFAARYGVVVLLKGAGTVVTDGQRVAINTTGNSGMATGGCGDVLTGLIAALLAQGMEPFHAARLGAHLHGLAGDLAAAELSQPGLIASDLPKYIGKAWLQLPAS